MLGNRDLLCKAVVGSEAQNMGHDLSMDTELKGGPKIPAPWLLVHDFAVPPPSLCPRSSLCSFCLLFVFIPFSFFPFSSSSFSCFSSFMLPPALNWYSLGNHSRKGSKAEGYPLLGWTGPMSGCPSYTLSFKKRKKKKEGSSREWRGKFRSPRNYRY